MLDELVHVIELLRKRIHDHREKLQANEIRTRMALVDPLLQALGWDVADPSIVIPEYDVGEGRADYALLGPDGRTKVTVVSLGGQISATTRSLSVTRTVSPAAANRTYSLSRLLSTSMPTDLTERERSDW